MTTAEIERATAKFAHRHEGKPVDILAALIDMDGTLYDSMKWHSRAWETLAAEESLKTTDGEFFFHEGRTGVATLDILFMRNHGRHITPEEAERLYRRKTELFAAMPPVEPIEGAAEMLATLRDSDIDRVLVTGSGQATLLDRLDIDFPGIFTHNKRITSRDVTLGKPHPEPYLKAMRLAGCTANNCIVVENAPLGVEAGAASGAFTIAITTGPIPRSAMADAGADLIFASMREFADTLPMLIESLKSR